MIISNTETVVTAISAVNECVTFFQWVRSLWSHWNRTENQEDGVPNLQSSLGSHSSGTEKQELKEDDVLKLQSSFQCLRDTLPAMYNFINRVEWRSHEKGVAKLLPELKAAVQDAEDLLEDFRCYELKVKIEGSATSAEPGTKFFQDFIQGNFSKLIHIQQRLLSQYSLLEGMSLHQASPRFDGSVRPETTSFPNKAKIFGRDDEIKRLIRMLGVPVGPSRLKKRSAISASNQVCGALDNNEATITCVPILPIVGMGGVGKTSLAQIICSHPQVQKHFDVIVWICAEDDFDVRRLTEKAIEQFSRKATMKDNLDSLQVDLTGSINKRRFLIVLDDLWAENMLLWERFCAPFKYVPEGSIMLVTTRSPTVANILRTMDAFQLEGLKDNVSQNFFKQCVFGSDSSNNDPIDVPSMWEPQHFTSTSAGTQAAISSHTDVPPMWPPPMPRRHRGQINNDYSILKVLKIVLRMNKDMNNALHREKQARKRDSKRIKRGLRQIKKLRKEAGKEVSPSESEAEELEVQSEDEQYPDFDALISQVPSGQHYGGYGYGFGGQFHHPGPSLSSSLQQHQQFGPRDYFNAANTGNSGFFSFYGGSSPAGSGYGQKRKLSFTDSEASYGSEPDSPPPEGKGKAIAVDGNRRRRRTRNPGGFMAAARRSHP